MSHAVGAVRFDDGKILYYEYDGTSDVVIQKLYDTRVEVHDHWRAYPPVSCTCGGDEPVRIMSTYGGGSAWDGRACRHCHAVTDGLTDEASWDNGTDEDREPDWSPWKSSSDSAT